MNHFRAALGLGWVEKGGKVTRPVAGVKVFRAQEKHFLLPIPALML